MTEYRPGEDITAFTMRRIRNDIIDECAKAVAAQTVGEDGVPLNDPTDIAYNMAIEHAAEAVLALKA